jgi:hypothetical protein
VAFPRAARNPFRPQGDGGNVGIEPSRRAIIRQSDQLLLPEKSRETREDETQESRRMAYENSVELSIFG